jgi:PhzF family phenazine biosynthesis protein
MRIPIYQVDAFTNELFSGNPAAVCLLNEEMETSWMQSVAAEMNLSETAFLLPEKDGYHLRWFTPKIEVDLCGHATLASAFILFQKNLIDRSKPVKFYTRSGELTAVKSADWIKLNFPAYGETPYQAPVEFLQALGVTPINTVKSGENVVIEVATENEVRKLSPDFHTLTRTPLHGVAVTTRSISSQFDFISRYFAPWAGIDEDPVTGSAHCCLGPYWGKRLGKTTMMAFQASRRGGVLGVTLLEDRVLIAGQAVMVLEGDLLT